MEAKSKQKIDSAQIKILEASKATPADSDRYVIPMVLCNKKASTGVLTYGQKQGKKTPIINILSATFCCTRSLECPSTSINNIY